ncbi:MAG TPA: HslU--HslV peptidase ATPase subunit, partial [Deltaproteobacteria bacterium]|nr:HslU--HslV peptidase ATPase subunit [Deltaproteobacteria bacterium]
SAPTSSRSTPDAKARAVAEIALIAEYINEHTENIGARRLHTVMEKLLEEISFDADAHTGPVTIDGAYVKERLEPLMGREDLSRYIL